MSRRPVRDLRLAVRIRRGGLKIPFVIMDEARRAGLPISLGCALVQQESGDGSNVFGHDPTIFAGAGRVTRRKYLAYRARRGPRGAGGMQGVGPCQLTWWETQDEADREGGCWKRQCNVRVGFRHLAANIARLGHHAGIRAYNGAGPAAERYAQEVEAKAAAWHRRVT